MEDRKVNILANQTPGPGISCLWVEAPHLAASARPGEFVMAVCGEGSDPLLRRPISLHRYGPMVLARRQSSKPPPWITPHSVALLFNTNGLAREWLGRRQAGEEIQVLGPLGNGYELEPRAKRVVMGGGGTGLAPLIALADMAIARGCSVTILSAGRSAPFLYPRRWMQPEVTCVEVTEDGSAGEKGLITDILPKYVRDTDQVFLCGPVPMYKGVYDLWRKNSIFLPTQVLLEVRMACGFGICFGCGIETKQGMKLLCRDGPKFDLDQVVWEKL